MMLIFLFKTYTEYHMKFFNAFIILIICGTIYSCGENPSEATYSTSEIDSLVRNAGTLNTSVIARRTQKTVATESATINGIKYNVTKSTWDYYKNFSGAFVNFTLNSVALWSGSLVQGKDVRYAALNSLDDTKPRPPITLSINGKDKPLETTTIDNPNELSYSSALNTMRKSIGDNSKAGIITLIKTQGFSLEQSCMDLGISASWLPESAKTSFTITDQGTETSFFILLKQELYTVSAKEPMKPSEYFGKSIDINNFKSKISKTNPLCYVSSVTYGRLLMAKITYKGTKSPTEVRDQINNELYTSSGEARYTKGLDGGNYTFNGILLGGDGDATYQTYSGTSGKFISDFIDYGNNFTTKQHGYPISFTVKNLADNSMTILGESTTYSEKVFKVPPIEYQKFNLRIEGFHTETGCSPFYPKDIYYKMTVYNQYGNELINTVLGPSDGVRPNSEGWVYIQKEYELNLLKTSGSYFSISGSIYFNSSIGMESTIYGQKFEYPWNPNTIDNGYKVKNVPGYYVMDVYGGGNCRLGLVVKITKK